MQMFVGNKRDILFLKIFAKNSLIFYVNSSHRRNLENVNHGRVNMYGCARKPEKSRLSS